MDQGLAAATAAMGATPAASAEEAILTRRSMRAFLDREVPRATIERILEIAARAPSGTNTQPWQVLVVSGAVRAQLCRDLHAMSMAGIEGAESYKYYSQVWREPYLSRRRKIGWDMYASLGITRSDKPGMSAQHARNYLFFDAPVGLFFTIDKDLEIGSWLDYGMFLQNIMVAARGFGLHTCAQQSFVKYETVIRERLGVPAERMLICGMALGYADVKAPENLFPIERAPVAEFARFFGA